ncbi:hypothetical protein CHLRE_03g207500v5 [Chlamydomonas reinhardtii]|uniref:Uncharacterized protein n=1 Tax=Chlamydomonas reinhardtii TaxID=3055 RepID=A0A2K3DZ04_CHLRE|nr:uncharacterized protein CHLRE_03g207500v5 [Chlamydomonas reinhardtii]XP_042926447.1 uncharacterized protein CHLRE_03g207500v5 [Chlamydomonas reinhardtii]PNW85737.1 hypothetical protein CHLRE_03g207500v5 [Chlamydomonas reinhardtii]PNW85738.1 hypothetical protein CHLRE_03g207500v5 [Chlamydomonas reinhardtii]
MEYHSNFGRGMPPQGYGYNPSGAYHQQGYMGPPINDYARQHLPLHLQNGYRGQPGVPLHSRQAYGSYASGPYAPQGRPQHQYKAHHGHKRHRGQDGAPRLQELRSDNAKKARAHYQEIPDTPGVPRSVPRAPNNNDGILLAPGSTQLLPPGSHISEGTLHAVTPSALPGGEAQLWKNSYGNADKEAVALAAAAGLDFLGSFYGAGDDDLTGDEFDLGGGSDHDTDAAAAADGGVGGDVPPPTHDEEATYPASARRTIAAQSATIAELEEENLTLREKIYLLETQLREAQTAVLQRVPSGHSGDADSEAAAADGPATSSSS